jgi:hypothetical protein
MKYQQELFKQMNHYQHQQLNQNSNHKKFQINHHKYQRIIMNILIHEGFDLQQQQQQRLLDL